MKIVADENIPLLKEFFADIGEIAKYPGRAIGPAQIAGADILLVRSVTPVNAELLEGSSIRFVGTATIGLDHFDTHYLESKGIGYCSAPGCNARAVLEYVIGALSVLSEQQGFSLPQKTVGIVGRGQIGSRLENALRKLGVTVKSNDPPLEENDEQDLFPLEEVLNCDIVTLHVPLTRSGDHPTYRLLNAKRIQALRDNQILINTSRGEVVDEAALKQRLSADQPPTVILDVFLNEPAIDTELARLAHFATPHIAGYSLDGKTNGTAILYKSLCRFLGLPIRHKVGQFMPDPPLRKLAFSNATDPEWALHTAIRACYDVRHDDSNLRRTLSLEDDSRRAAFDRLRKEYRVRRGFDQVKILLKNGKADLINHFTAVGFNLQTK